MTDRDTMLDQRTDIREYRKYAHVELDLLDSGYELTDAGHDAVKTLLHDYYDRAADDPAHKRWPVWYGAGTYIHFDRLRIPVAHDLVADLHETLRSPAHMTETPDQ